MRRSNRTLFLSTPGTTARIQHEAVLVERPDQPSVRVPLRELDSIVAYGHINLTTGLIHACAAHQTSVAYLSRAGRFIARVAGPQTGSIHLRRRQHRTPSQQALRIVQVIINAKVLNSRTLLLDAAKDRPKEQADRLRRAGAQLANLAAQAREATSIDQARGYEGQAAAVYLKTLGGLPAQSAFRFATRTRRPPTDPANALLSFLYTLTTSRCVSACEAVGLDPQAGYLHTDRPGRPSLALDFVEELRAPLVDRFTLNIINRRQINEHHFTQRPGGACELDDDGRRIVLDAWDNYLNQPVAHRALDEQLPRRDIPHTQALLLARHLRGDLKHYLPYRSTGR